MTAQQTKKLRANLRAKFDAQPHERKELTNYFMPDGYDYSNLQTHFKDLRDPDEFLKEMTKLAELAKELGAEIVMKKGRYEGGYRSGIADGGMCFRTVRLEDDEDFKWRMEIERQSFVENEERKIRRKQREFDKGNALAKLTPKERKLLGIR